MRGFVVLWAQTFGQPESTNIILFLKYGQIGVAQSSQERRAAYASWTAANKGNWGSKDRVAFINRWQIWRMNLLDIHLLENIGSELLQSTDIYGTCKSIIRGLLTGRSYMSEAGWSAGGGGVPIWTKRGSFFKIYSKNTVL